MFVQGIDALNAQLQQDPYDEECHRMLMRLYAENHNRSAALKQFDKCRKIIKREFGAEPEPETVALRRQILMMPNGSDEA